MKVGKIYRAIENYPDPGFSPMYDLKKGSLVFVYRFERQQPASLKSYFVWVLGGTQGTPKMLRCDKYMWNRCFERVS